MSYLVRTNVKGLLLYYYDDYLILVLTHYFLMTENVSLLHRKGIALYIALFPSSLHHRNY
jgi:hypothetical protein